MKAIQCKELSEPDNWNTTIEFNDIEDPKFNNDQVLIEIKVASVNFPDVLMVQGKYQFQPPMPFIPGAEKRISLPFEDPKEFDDTSKETKKYSAESIKVLY